MEHNKKLYDEDLVQDIMIGTGLCLYEIFKDEKDISKIPPEFICEFIADNTSNIINHVLEEYEGDEDDEEDNP